MSFLFYNFWSRRRYDDEMENTWGCGSWFEYLVTVILSTVLLIAALVLTLFWVINYQGGFAWSENPKIQFNLHPVLMVAGFITLSGFCKYKVFYNIRRNTILLRYCGCTRHRGGIIWNDIFRCWEVFWFCILLGRQAPLVFPTSSASRNKNKLQIHIGILYHLNTIFLFVCLFVEFFFLLLMPSHSVVSSVPLLEARLCQVGAHLFPCIGHSVHRHRFLGRLRFA